MISCNVFCVWFIFVCVAVAGWSCTSNCCKVAELFLLLVDQTQGWIIYRELSLKTCLRTSRCLQIHLLSVAGQSSVSNCSHVSANVCFVSGNKKLVCTLIHIEKCLAPWWNRRELENQQDEWEIIKPYNPKFSPLHSTDSWNNATAVFKGHLCY